MSANMMRAHADANVGPSQATNWQAWELHHDLPGITELVHVALARDLEDSSNSGNVFVVSTLRQAFCSLATHAEGREAAFDKAFKLSARTGVFVSSNLQLLGRLKALDVVPGHATSVTLSRLKGVRLAVRAMGLHSTAELEGSLKGLARSALPGPAHIHATEAHEARAPAVPTHTHVGAYGNEPADGDDDDTMAYGDDSIFWPIDSPIPQKLPPRVYTTDELGAA